MGYKKSKYGVYSSYLKVDNVVGPTNISNILKRNKIEEQKEKYKTTSYLAMMTKL